MDIFKIAFNVFPKLATKRFILREAKKQDSNELYEIYSNEEAVRYHKIEPMESMEQAQKAVHSFLNGYKSKKFIRWCIADKDYDKVIGLIMKLGFTKEGLKKESAYNRSTDNFEDRLIYGLIKTNDNAAL